jgi:hypothetical protein
MLQAHDQVASRPRLRAGSATYAAPARPCCREAVAHRTRSGVRRFPRTCPRVPTMCPVCPAAVSRSVLMLGSKKSAPPEATMHLSDTLVFGPLHPLLPQPVRVRLVALLVGLVAGLGILTFAGRVLVLGPAALPASARSLLPGWASPAEPKATTQQILVSRNPVGAAVLIGGRELSRTPATVSTFPGLILTLRRAGFLDAFVAVSAPSADVTLW